MISAAVNRGTGATRLRTGLGARPGYLVRVVLWLRYLAAVVALIATLGAARGPGALGPRLGLLGLGAAVLVLVFRGCGVRSSGRAHLGALAGAGLAVVAGEVVYIHASGLSDQRTPADAILVLGAKVNEDGSPSEALAERVATGVELFKQGLSPVLLVSGGVGHEGHDESVVMKQMAMRQGVPEGSIVVDGQGNNTEASLLNARAWLAQRGGGELLVVSHYHHLPRVRLLGLRHGVSCHTVHADEGATLLAGTPYYVAREAAALAYYYLRG